MNDLIIREWNGRVIRQRDDGYLSATDMCQALGRLFADWNRLKSTTEYLQALEVVMHIPITELVIVKQGGTPEQQGTWVHRRVALRLSQWLSPEFAIQVDEWIEELLTKGTVSLSLSPAEQLLAQAQHMVDQERRTKRLELTQSKQSEDITELKQITASHDTELNRIFTPNGNYYSVLGYWRLKHKGEALSTIKAVVLGRRYSL